MTTVWLLWQLISGAPGDVDAFLFEGQCVEMRQALLQRLQSAREQTTSNPELDKITISECISTQIKAPK